MAESFLGEIIYFCGSFAPYGWKMCDGSTLSISQYSALFTLIGTAYGGDGQTTFNIPDLRGRVAVGQGQGNGLSQRTLGDSFGSEHIALGIPNMPSHTHGLSVYTTTTATGRTAAPSPSVALSSPTATRAFRPAAATTVDNTLDGTALYPAGGNAAHENRQPFLALSACIALVGIYPSRN